MKKINIDQKPEECRQSQNTVAELYIENKNLKKRNMETQQRRSEMHTETAVTEKKFTGTALNRKILQKNIWTNLDILAKSCPEINRNLNLDNSGQG